MRRALATAALLLHATSAAADTKLPAELEGIDILDRRGAELPRELAFVDQDGRAVKLGDYLDGERPLVLVLAYYQCPMLCSLVLNAVVDGAKGLGFEAGESYRILTVSIDPRDGAQLAAGKRKAYHEALGLDAPAPRAWDFLVQRPGDEASVKQLARTIGFEYRWDAATEQFAHAAGVFVFTPDGRLSRTLTGIQFPSKDLRLSLVEASEGKLGSAWDKVLLLCYHYQPGEGYSVAIMRIMRLGGALFVIGLAAFLIHLWRRERSQRSGAEPRAA
jgi:protein SCO1/2